MEVKICCKACGEALEGENTLVCPTCHRAWESPTAMRWGAVTA